MLSEATSHNFTEVELTVVELMYPQDVMHFESALFTNLGEVQAEHMNAIGEPRPTV